MYIAYNITFLDHSNKFQKDWIYKLDVTLLAGRFVTIWYGYDKHSNSEKYCESWSTNISYLDFGLKPAVFGCFTNTIAPPIALECCSNP